MMLGASDDSYSPRRLGAGKNEGTNEPSPQHFKIKKTALSDRGGSNSRPSA